jgi:hypothetical protein
VKVGCLGKGRRVNELGQTFLNLVGRQCTDGVLRMIALNRTSMSNTASFVGRFIAAHAHEFTRFARKIDLDRLLKCLTCER